MSCASPFSTSRWLYSTALNAPHMFPTPGFHEAPTICSIQHMDNVILSPRARSRSIHNVPRSSIPQTKGTYLFLLESLTDTNPRKSAKCGQLSQQRGRQIVFSTESNVKFSLSFQPQLPATLWMEATSCAQTPNWK